MKKEDITCAAHTLWEKFHERNPRRLCQLLDILIVDLPMGQAAHDIKGLIQKNSRCYCIVLNSDLPGWQQDLITFHEIGHSVLGHAERKICTCRNLFSRTENSIMEIEANEFVAEYLMDTDRTLELLQETGSFFSTASFLHVPPAIMDFKWRMLKYYELVSGESPFYSRSDCMGRLERLGASYDDDFKPDCYDDANYNDIP